MKYDPFKFTEGLSIDPFHIFILIYMYIIVVFMTAGLQCLNVTSIVKHCSSQGQSAN